MELWKMKTVLVYLASTRLYCDILRPEEIELFYSMPRLKELCPYSDFCGLNASKEYVYDGDRMPCCQSCSCSSDCGYHGTCCFHRLDANTNMQESMICRNTFEIDPEINEYYADYISEAVPNYWIVNKCNMVTDKCGDLAKVSNKTYTSFSPVFATSTGHTYFNTFLAKCNNVSDIIPWQRLLSCPTNAETSLSDILNNDNDVEISQQCFSYYIPPDTEANFIQCYANVIRKCNVTGLVSEKDEFWPLCEMFNSSFIAMNSRYMLTYANVYCYLCNTATLLESTISRMECSWFGQTGHKNPLMSSAALTIILNLSQKKNTPVIKQREEQCGSTSQMVRSFHESCRPIKCPTGQIRYKGQCDFHSEKWIGGPFVVMLRLFPDYKDAFLQTSSLENILIRNKNDRKASWIKRNALRYWHINVFYHPFKNMSHVEYITVKAVHPLRTVNPKVLKDSVRKALEDTWIIEYQNKRYTFKVEFNEFEKYSIFEVPGNDALNVTRYGYYPHTKTSCQLEDIADFEYKHIIYSLTKKSRSESNDGMFITKMFFCNQVELLPDDYEFSPPSCLHNIFFKVKNQTMHRFTALPTTNYPEPYSPIKSFHRVLVCLDEFGETANENTSLFESCRPIKCPTGQIRYKGQCDFHSEKWIGGPFVVMLRLFPDYKDAYLQTLSLENILKRNKYDRKASWIQRNALRYWYINLFYHPSKDMSHVEHITVKAVHPLRTVNPKVLKDSVRKALQDTWIIEYQNKSYTFKVEFNEFEKYSIFEVPVNDVLNVTRYGYYPHKKTWCQHEDSVDFEYKDILYSLTKKSRSELNDGIFITKMFFCNQVELLSDEYQFSPPSCIHYIFFKVKNHTMHRFTALPTTNYPDLSSTLKSFYRVLVCLDEFGETANENTSLFVNIKNLFLMLSLKLIITWHLNCHH